MQKYTYSPPKVKASTKLVPVIDGQNRAVCSFKRVYNHFFERLADSLLGFDYVVQLDVLSSDGRLRFRGKKLPRWGRTQYEITDCSSNETYRITYKSWQAVAPEFRITSNSGEYSVKKEPMGWAAFYDQGVEAARWKMKTTEMFKTYLEIDDHCPIQEPAFFVCLFQCLFYIGK
ncbi:hypothetical protein D3P08_16430 [Paenibacillus nanensis]|uniref:Tubby C-terminal domain-containing protein n=1 Tax=Paenibacillus nanensis TaxID=393251 RepID=A0A3A1USI8_9BACL|nr:hypothetical protein [Paenibacillus nanensis]RIX51498.1 hypothetical protein D3P08_16430 [Paenibacillus nanensis]